MKTLTDAIQADAPPQVWAIVELMGHVKLAGRLTEEERFGAKMGRLDVPMKVACPLLNAEAHALAPDACPECSGRLMCHGFVTQYFGGGSVYRITVVSEDVARHVAGTVNAAPVSQWDWPERKALARVPDNDVPFDGPDARSLYGDDDDNSPDE